MKFFEHKNEKNAFIIFSVHILSCALDFPTTTIRSVRRRAVYYKALVLKFPYIWGSKSGAIGAELYKAVSHSFQKLNEMGAGFCKEISDAGKS